MIAWLPIPHLHLRYMLHPWSRQNRRNQRVQTTADMNASLGIMRIVSDEALMLSSQATGDGLGTQASPLFRFIPGTSVWKETPSSILCHRAPNFPWRTRNTHWRDRHALPSGLTLAKMKIFYLESHKHKAQRSCLEVLSANIYRKRVSDGEELWEELNEKNEDKSRWCGLKPKQWN